MDAQETLKESKNEKPRDDVLDSFFFQFSFPYRQKWPIAITIIFSI